MTYSRRVLAVAAQPGGANALVPVVRELSDRGAVVRCVGFEAAVPVFSRAGVLDFELSKGAAEAAHTPQSAARGLLDETLPDVVLCASTGGDTHNHTIAAARDRGIPTVGVLDHWNELDRRFRGGPADDPFFFAPDVLAVPDEIALENLRALGCKRPRIFVTGQPYLDTVMRSHRPTRAAARVELGIMASGTMLVFATEPVLADYGPISADSSLGYTEVEVLDCVLQGFAEAGCEDATLVVRPHPRERLAAYATVPTSDARIRVQREGPISNLLAAADVVIGMTSMAILEAACLGATVVSLQPGARRPKEFPFSNDMFYVAFTITECIRLVAAAARGDLTASAKAQVLNSRFRLDGRVAKRVADLTFAACSDGSGA